MTPGFTQISGFLSGDSASGSMMHFVTSGFDGVINPLPLVTHDILLGWNLLVLGFVLLSVVVNRHLYPRQFRQLLSVPGGVAQTNQLLREWSPKRSFIGFSSWVAYVVLMGLFFQKSLVVLSHDAVRYNGILVFALSCGGTALLLLMRYFSWLFTSRLFRIKEMMYRLSAMQLSVTLYCILVLQVVLWLLLYNPYSVFVWIGVAIIVIAALLRFFIGFVEIKVFIRVRPFYIFYYLCSLEIIPMAVLLVAGIRYATTGSVI